MIHITAYQWSFIKALIPDEVEFKQQVIDQIETHNNVNIYQIYIEKNKEEQNDKRI